MAYKDTLKNFGPFTGIAGYFLIGQIDANYVDMTARISGCFFKTLDARAAYKAAVEKKAAAVSSLKQLETTFSMDADAAAQTAYNSAAAQAALDQAQANQDMAANQPLSAPVFVEDVPPEDYPSLLVGGEISRAKVYAWLATRPSFKGVDLTQV